MSPNEVHQEKMLTAISENHPDHGSVPLGTPETRSPKSEKAEQNVEGQPGIRSLRSKKFLDDPSLEQGMKISRDELGAMRIRIRSWVDDVRFTAFSACVIILNAAYIGIETDYNEPHVDDDTMWLIFETCFSTYFVIELILRWLAYGSRTFIGDAWNIFDIFIVSTAAVDLILTLAVEGNEEANKLTILRIFRIFRSVRIFRLLRFFRKLWLLVSSIAGASKLLVWVWILLVIIIYIFAVFMTRVVGKNHGENPVVQKHVGDIGASMFTFFVIMTTESWPDICRALGEVEPISFAVIILYMAVTFYAVLNVVIAVIVDVTLSRASEIKDDKSQLALKEEQRVFTKIYEVFHKADENGDGLLTKEEFEEALKLKEVRENLHGVKVNPRDADELFDILDQDESGTLTYTEFINGVQRARAEVSAKNILELQCDIWKSAHQSEVYVKELQERMDRIAERSRVRTEQLETIIESVKFSFQEQVALVLDKLQGRSGLQATRPESLDSHERALDSLCEEVNSCRT